MSPKNAQYGIIAGDSTRLVSLPVFVWYYIKTCVKFATSNGKAFKQAVIDAGAVRAKPIILTGLAAMIGALFILDDPIFSGLAISLIFGILISTILTLVIIPVLYYAFMHKQFEQ